MTDTKKKQLQNRCLEWVAAEEGRSQAQLAQKLGISKPYMSRICKGNWTEQAPSNAEWLKVARFFGVDYHIDSHNYLEIVGACEHAHGLAEVVGISGYTGAGKSYALRRYWKQAPHCYLIQADPTMSKGAFLREIAEEVGVDKVEQRQYDLMKAVVKKLRSVDGTPLLIFDEIEYLPRNAWNIIKSIMDKLDGRCGFVVSGIFKEVLEKEAGKGRSGMPQFRRRVGHSWVVMRQVAKAEVKALCSSVGITERPVIDWLCTNCSDFDALTTYVKTMVRVADSNGLPMDINLVEQLFND